MKLSFSLFIIAAASCVAACSFNYPQPSDAQLFILLVNGFDRAADCSATGAESQPQTTDVGDFRISRALESEFILGKTVAMGDTTCSGAARVTTEKERKITITKVRESLDLDDLTENRGELSEARGGALFGHGAHMEGASLLSLTYALVPFDARKYRWQSPDEKLFEDLPYRHVYLPEISLSTKALDLFCHAPMVFDSPSDPNGQALADDQQITLADQPAYDKDSNRYQVHVSRLYELEFMDGRSIVPIQGTVENGYDGWMDLIGISRHPDSTDYMAITRMLTLAQAGDCDSAFDIYLNQLTLEDRALREQLLTILAHIHGQSGGNVSAVLDELEKVMNSQDNVPPEETTKRLEHYRQLNSFNH